MEKSFDEVYEFLKTQIISDEQFNQLFYDN